MASDKNTNTSIIKMKDDTDRIHKLGDNQLMNVSGEAGGDVEFSDFIQKNFDLYFYRNGYHMSPNAVASFARASLSEALRSRSGPYPIHALIGGFDEQTKQTQLYFLDYFGSKVEIPFGCHGYSSFFCLSILDRFYKEDMTEDDAIGLMQMLLNELKKRFIVSIPELLVKVLNVDHSYRELTLVPA